MDALVYFDTVFTYTLCPHTLLHDMFAVKLLSGCVENEAELAINDLLITIISERSKSLMAMARYDSNNHYMISVSRQNATI